MILDNATHCVLKISELTRLIVSHLVLTDQKSAVSLARACRYLEESTLSILWGAWQWSLCTLLKVLPEESWVWEYPELGRGVFTIVGDSSPVAWGRVRRYASWMRQLDMVELPILGGDTFLKLRLNSPPSGGWFPVLRILYWTMVENSLPYADLFFSPHLEEISLFTPLSWDVLGTPLGILPAIASVISTLPTSDLRFLEVHGWTEIPWECLADSLTSVLLRCRPSFTQLTSPIPLSDVAANHLMQLPHLSNWVIYGPPPNYSSLSSPLTFPPLETLTFKEGVVRGWLSLFNRLEDDVSAAQEVAPLSKVKQSLKALIIKDLPGLTVDTSLASPIQKFRNLTRLDADIECHKGQCIFKLNNDDVTELAMTLPRLECFRLGRTCCSNTCATTVACLLQISIHCLELDDLEIHFNTTNIVEDFKRISEDPRLQQLRSLPRCPLQSLRSCYRMPLTLDESGVETVASGMIDIFPSLRRPGWDGSWDNVSKRIEELRKM